MAEFIAVNMREKTGNEDFKAACRGSQGLAFFFFSILGCEQ